MNKLTPGIANYFISCFILLLLFTGCKQEDEGLTEKDKMEIEKLQKDIPLILANQGWETYEKSFTDDYQNWSMARDKVVSRETFLEGVKSWYDEGNRAVDSDIKTVGYISIAPNTVLYLHQQIEKFEHNQTTDRTERDIRFVSIFKKVQGQWKIQFTAFMDAPGKKD